MKVNGKDDIPYIKENKNVPNHQPVYQMICNIGGVSTIEAEDCGLWWGYHIYTASHQ